jgi:phosphohistidine phosphatase SixA/8-oxo-dGTP pyrophosphatase MutT (NUDIX family)
MGSRTVHAAGVVLLAEGKKSPKVLLVHRPRHSDWSLPKGKLDSSEHVVAAAVRECDEETGVVPILQAPLGRQEYQIPGGDKIVDYWRASAGVDNGFVPDNEVDEIAWVSPGRARKMLTYDRDAEFLDRALTMPTTSPLVILRHALAEKRRDFSGKDRRRPLSGRGRTQAKTLATLLAAFGCDRIVSSPAVRCTRTVAPLAKRSDRKIVTEPAFSEESAARRPDRALAAISALLASKRPTVVCSHRPVLPLLIEPLLPQLSEKQLQLVQEPLPAGGMLVVHREMKKKGWRLTAIERHLL